MPYRQSVLFPSVLMKSSKTHFLDVMPETNYKAATAVIERWKSEFPETYDIFSGMSEVDIQQTILNSRRRRKWLEHL